MAPWWEDPTEAARLYAGYLYISFFLLGVYGWEYFQTFGIEYAIIRRDLSFRWPLIPYLVGRISLLISAILLVIALSTSSLGCTAGSLSPAISGAISMGCASTNLMIRTWVIWNDSRPAHVLLSLATLAYWALMILDIVNVKAYGSTGDCIMYLTHPAVGAAMFLYTMCYDFLVLVLSFVGLSRQTSKSPLQERLRAQGLLYFVISAISYIPPTVFSFIGCATLVGITGSVALIASMIGSCRVVRSLLILRTSHPSGTLHEGGGRDVVLTTQFAGQVPTTSTYAY